MKKIPFSPPDITEEEIQAVCDRIIIINIRLIEFSLGYKILKLMTLTNTKDKIKNKII